MSENYKKAGRKQNIEISTSDMLVYLEKYLKEFPNEKINIKKLADFSGIQRHYWYSREGIKQKIDEINIVEYSDYEIIISDTSKNLLQLPDVDSLVENNYRSKIKLKQVIGSYFDTIQEFYESACEKFSIQKELNKVREKLYKLEQKNKELEEEKKHYMKLAEHYRKKVLTLSIRSTETKFREENNIKSNIIKLDEDKRYMLTTESDKMEELINSLGED